MRTMQAIRVHAYGITDGLSLDTLPLPQFSADEILVRVHAASVNPVDWKVCDGILKEKLVMHLPFIPGGDFSGRVAAVGSAVKAFRPGSEVFGMTSTPGYRAGAFAEYVAVKAADAAEKPYCIDHVQAASVPLAALTAWQAVFDRAAVRRGQRVLIHAGAGGVGGFAIQFARETGAYVITTTSAGNADYVRALGADQVIDYHAQKFEEVLTDIDVVIDLLGEDVQRRSYAVLRPGGVLVNAWGTLMEERANAAGVRALKVAVEANGTQLSEIARLIDAGKVKTSIAAKIPYADAAAGLGLSRTGHIRGKIVLAMIDVA
jgi:NADPH:quinone reductase-like Zn-dependent oxidoreductase